MVLLNDPVDSWTKAMSKLAEDVVCRIFDYLLTEMAESESNEVNKDVLLKSFVNGKSTSKSPDLLPSVMKKHVGKQIYVKKNKKPFQTADLFENPLMIHRDGTGLFTNVHTYTNLYKEIFLFSYR